MLTMRRALAGLTLCFALAACASAPAELSQADQDAVKAMIEKYRLAGLAADWDAWGNTLAADVVVSPANLPTMTGRAAAVTWVKTFPKLTGFTVNIDEITGRGDVAIVRGTYELKMQMPDSSAASDRGAFLEVHRRQADGSWPYTHLSFHTTEPLPPAAPPKK